jgi:hypothetical protein
MTLRLVQFHGLDFLPLVSCAFCGRNDASHTFKVVLYHNDKIIDLFPHFIACDKCITLRELGIYDRVS